MNQKKYTKIETTVFSTLNKTTILATLKNKTILFNNPSFHK